MQVILVRHCEEKTAQGIVVSLKDSFGFIERADEISEVSNLEPSFCMSSSYLFVQRCCHFVVYVDLLSSQ